MKIIRPPQSDFIKDAYCSYCGSKFAEQILWPRICWMCHKESYSNPTPVVVALIEVWDHGILIQQRNIEPMKDKWALISGYLNLGETWQEGLAREVQEEMGLITKPEDYELFDVCMGTYMNTLLVFGQHRYGVHLDEIKFEPNHEVSAMRMVREPEELAFPSHTVNLRKCL
jgi:8-oxo-dGTP diphosphatase